MCATEAAAAATPEIPMLAPAPAAGDDAAISTTGSRILPSTSPTSPPERATAKHQAATATSANASKEAQVDAAAVMIQVEEPATVPFSVWNSASASRSFATI